MNKVLKIATVLTWINMIFWSFACLILLLGILSAGSTALLITLIFPSAVVLHSYASFQLQKSLRNPAIPLSNQTSTGIRFIGFVAMFVGISNLLEGFGIFQNGKELLKLLQERLDQVRAQFPPQWKDFNFTMGHIRLFGTMVILIGLCVAVNVNLNFRLLRWYYFLRNNADNSEK